MYRSHRNKIKFTNNELWQVLQRSLIKQQEFESRIKDEMEEEERRRVFIAQNLPETTFVKGFEPDLKHSKVVPDNVVLASDVRANARKEFDRLQEERLDEAKKRRETQEFIEKQKEEEELRKYRKQLCHKARPLPKFISKEAPSAAETHTHHHNVIPLTVAESPFLMTKQRAKTHE